MSETPMIELPLELVTRLCQELLDKDKEVIELAYWPTALEFIAYVAGTAQ